MLITQPNYTLQLLDFGPFNIPQKKEWIILGSGPTLLDFKKPNNLDIGVITLNTNINRVSGCDINIQSHYETYLLSKSNLYRAGIIFIANPLHVGWKCIPMDTFNLFDYSEFERDLPNKVRFFEKETSLKEAFNRNHCLYCYETIASAALFLLYRNGINKVTTYGIDGGDSHSDTNFIELSNTHKATYDNCLEEFNETAKKLHIKIKKEA